MSIDLENRISKTEWEIEQLKKAVVSIEKMSSDIAGLRGDFKAYLNSEKSIRKRQDTLDNNQQEDRIKLNRLENKLIVIDTKMKGILAVVTIIGTAVFGLLIDFIRSLV